MSGNESCMENSQWLWDDLTLGAGWGVELGAEVGGGRTTQPSELMPRPLPPAFYSLNQWDESRTSRTGYAVSIRIPGFQLHKREEASSTPTQYNLSFPICKQNLY